MLERRNAGQCIPSLSTCSLQLVCAPHSVTRAEHHNFLGELNPHLLVYMNKKLVPAFSLKDLEAKIWSDKDKNFH